MRVIRLIFFSLLLGCLLHPAGLYAQDYFEVQAKPDTNSIRIGEQVKLHLSARVNLYVLKGASFKVIFPQVPDSLNHWEVVSRSHIDTSGGQYEKIFKQTLTLTSFDSGRWEIPALKFEVFSVTDGSYDSVFTTPVLIDVNTVKVDTTKAFKPIKNIRTVPFRFMDYWPFIAGGVGALLLIALFIWLYLRRKKKPVPVVVAPSSTPYETATRELQVLKAEKLWQQGDIKQYYTRLTDILRTYFEHQFGIAALEQTSAELLQNIKPVTILNQQRDKLRSILAISDLAKFAKLQPTPEEHESCMQQAEAILEWTRPKAVKDADQSAPHS